MFLPYSISEGVNENQIYLNGDSDVLFIGMGKNDISNPRCLGRCKQRKVKHCTFQDIWEIMTKIWTEIINVSFQYQVFEHFFSKQCLLSYLHTSFLSFSLIQLQVSSVNLAYFFPPNISQGTSYIIHIIFQVLHVPFNNFQAFFPKEQESTGKLRAGIFLFHLQVVGIITFTESPLLSVILKI